MKDTGNTNVETGEWESSRTPFMDAMRSANTYNPERHDPDSVFFDDSYVGASELELGGGCTRCGCPDDCMCNG